MVASPQLSSTGATSAAAGVVRYALARLVIAVGRMISAAGWRLMPADLRLGHYVRSTYPRERMIAELIKPTPVRYMDGS